MNIQSILLATLLVTDTTLATAQSSMKPMGDHAGMQASSMSMEMTNGEVRKVDKDARKITIKHGEIKNLGMPPMTMVFQVKDPAMLDKVKAGDKVQFLADQINGAITLTAIDPVK